MKLKKRTTIMLAVFVSLILVSSLFSSLIQSSFGSVKVVNYNNVTLAEIAEKIDANNAETGRNIEATFTRNTKYEMTYKVLTPDNATKDNPSPAIVVMHGGLSDKETTSPVFVELARRGYTVIAFDAMGHGKTDREIDDYTHNTMGMEAMVELIMSMPNVDPTNIGVTGHSWGNNGSAAVVNQINLETSNPRIKAFLCAQGTLAIYDLKEGAMDNVLFGLSVGKYDEMDTTYMGSYTLPTQAWALGWIKAAYPEFSGDSVPMGVWFDADGAHEIAEGEKYTGTNGRVMYNPANTHPAALFSKTAVKVNIDFFYNALGVPNGAKMISSSNQTWVIMAVFSTIGMLSWFGLILPVIDILLEVPCFRTLKKREEESEILPKFKSIPEIIGVILMFGGLSFFTYKTIFPLTTAGSKYIPISNFFPNAAHQSNAFGFWAFITALVALAGLLIVTVIKKLAYRKSGYEVINPLKCVDIPSRKIWKNIVLALAIAAILYAVVFAIEGIFKVDFRLATLEFTTFRLDKVFVMLRYALLFGGYYLVNAILTANTRYNDMPEWLSVVIVSVGNCLGLLAVVIHEYSSLVNTGLLATPDACSTCTLMFTFFCPMTIAPIIARYATKKTGNVWLGAAINTFIFTMSLVGSGQYMYATQVITAFGL